MTSNKEMIEKISGQVCHWVVQNIGDVVGKPLVAWGKLTKDGDADNYVIGISDPRIMRTIQVNAADKTPPNAMRLNATNAIIFVPPISRMNPMYFGGENNISAFGVVEDKALLSAYIAATTGLIMAGAKIEEVKQ